MVVALDLVEQFLVVIPPGRRRRGLLGWLLGDGYECTVTAGAVVEDSFNTDTVSKVEAGWVYTI